MTEASRSNVVSSFTIIKGALIQETYAAFRQWDLLQSHEHNLQRLKEGDVIAVKSANWLRDVVFVLRRRFDPAGRDRALVELALAGCDIEIWKPLLLWHMTRDEFLLRDFLLHWLFPRRQNAAERVRSEDVLPYLAAVPSRGVKVASQWSESTSKRVAAGLLRIAADFGLLKGSNVKTFTSYQLREESFMYLLHACLDQERSGDRVVECPDWRMFLMARSDVEAELYRLHQFRKIHYEAAGSLVQLDLPCASLAEYARKPVA